MDFSALHVALSGLRAAQVGIDTTSHNVSNASTEGFTRQRVDLAARRPRPLPVGQLGTGVDITDITRARSSFLDARVRSSIAGAAELGVRASFLAKAENVFAEPDLGISGALEGLFDAFEELSLEPTDMSASGRRQVDAGRQGGGGQ
jgi:flagellar hook-associated protein 1